MNLRQILSGAWSSLALFGMAPAVGACVPTPAIDEGTGTDAGAGGSTCSESLDGGAPSTACATPCDGGDDSTHCDGGCDHACATDEVCSHGTCVPQCKGGTILCGESCVDPTKDAAHCGGCDHACGSGRSCVAGKCDAPSSCQGTTTGAGAGDCGPSSSTDCCESKLVTGGAFERSYDGVTFTDKSHPATVSGFRLDTYEITVGRFRRFVEAGKGTQASPPSAGDGAHPLIADSGWQTAWDANLEADSKALVAALECSPTYQTWTGTIGDNERKPINCITWYEAFSFCAWDGARLPTEAEWNYTAAAGSDQRAYPWSKPATSTEIDCTYASYGNCVGGPGSSSNLIVVGTKPAGNGAWGQADLGGNVWEWSLDGWASPYGNPCVDCANLMSTSHRVVRGGSFNGDASYLFASTRSYNLPTFRSGNVGARCARGP